MHVMPGEIKIWPGATAPVGWMFCHGQGLYISAHEELFGILGTRFGGDGLITFNLPDLRNAVIVGVQETDSSDLGESTGLVTSGGGDVALEAESGGLPALRINYIIALVGQLVSY